MSKAKTMKAKFKDEDGVHLVIEPNVRDDNDFAEKIRLQHRPILLQIESEIFSSYKFTNYALTVDEARSLVNELNKFIKYIEGE